MPSGILINGKNYDYGNVGLILFGVPVVGITEIEYTTKQDKEMNYGAGYNPTSYGYGKKSYTGSITLYTDEVRAIINSQPATQNRDILAIPPFSIPVLFEGIGVPLTKDVLSNVMFTENPFNTKQGDTKILCRLPFIFAGLAQ